MSNAAVSGRARCGASAPTWLDAVVGSIGFVLLLEFLPRLGLVSPNYLPPFSVIMGALGAELQQSAFWIALANTMRTWAIGLTISMIAGSAIGIMIGSSSLLLAITRSTIEFLRPIPSVALIPLAILLFGTEVRSTLLLVVYASFWQVLIQALYGAQDVDPVARETARSYSFKRWAQVRYVIWPTALPYLMTGLRLAAAVSLILTITGELTIGTPGLGKEIYVAQTSGAITSMYAYVIVAGTIGVIVNVLARTLERRVLRWHPSIRLEPTS